MKCFTLVSLLLPLSLMALAPAAAHPGHGQSQVALWQQASPWPDRIVLNPGADPSRSFSLTWRTDASVGRTVAELVEASEDTRFDQFAQSFEADTQRLDLEVMPTENGPHEGLFNHGLGKVHYHSITFDALKPDTLYAYRVRGDRGHWSEWFQTRTPAAEGPLEFVYFGDAQNGIRSHWSRVIRMAYQTVPNADFFLHAGDLVDKSDSDQEWAEWFAAGSFIHSVIPSVPVRGNHENITVVSPEGKRQRVPTPMWRPQFTLPVEQALPETLHESNYQLNYGDRLHVFVVDSARKHFEDTAAWLDQALAESNATWKLVTMHHPYFVPDHLARNKTDLRRKAALGAVIDKHEVDLVLTGHIHTYLRGSAHWDEDHMARTLTGEPQSVKTVYAISAAGAKNSVFPDETPTVFYHGDNGDGQQGPRLERYADNTPMFQHIAIDGERIEYKAYTAIGTVYDAFSLEKGEDGRKTLINGEASFGDLRLFDNTAPYSNAYDLQ
ncbi:FN3 domain-containing metallophosphoesterase family protein [Ferrimonas pelagia]|uniref:Metallophosphoesterase family protein n=1 Tax=Ferrimonas pelagia TaxID=1177826 RepID=A0ABP9EIH0_9GAMM